MDVLLWATDGCPWPGRERTIASGVPHGILANLSCNVKYAWMIARHGLKAVQDALNRQAAVALLGPRQVGKTTLALAIDEQAGALYLDLEARADRNKLSDPVLFLRAYEDRQLDRSLVG